MLITCPKCGFNQPQDKYCAQCGVDMESFKPQEESTSKKLFRNPAFHITLFVLFIAGLVALYLGQTQEGLGERLSSFGVGIQVASSVGGEAAEAPEEFSEAQTESFLPGDVDATNSPATPVPPADNSKNFLPNSASGSGKIKVTYAEISRTNLGLLLSEAQKHGEVADFRDYAAGSIGDFAQKTKTFNLKVLHSEEVPLKSATAAWFHGLRDKVDPEIEVGLHTFIEIQRPPEGLPKVSLEIQRSWREATTDGTYALTRRQFPALLEVPPNTAIFITGFLPTRANLDEMNSDLSAIPVFKILDSPEFQRRQSDFVVFIEIL